METTPQIEDLKPGRALDAKVALEVMGWTDIEWVKPAHMGYEVAQGIPPLKPDQNPTGYRPKLRIPNYSEDIGAAWPIAEMYKSQGNYKLEISAYAKDEFWTIKAFHHDGYAKSCTTSARTLAHAICLAALKATSK